MRPKTVFSDVVTPIRADPWHWKVPARRTSWHTQKKQKATVKTSSQTSGLFSVHLYISTEEREKGEKELCEYLTQTVIPSFGSLLQGSQAQGNAVGSWMIAKLHAIFALCRHSNMPGLICTQTQTFRRLFLEMAPKGRVTLSTQPAHIVVVSVWGLGSSVI